MSGEMDAAYKMTFGKHKGERLRDIPVGYLDWLIGEDWLSNYTKEIITRHLETSRAAEWSALADDEAGPANPPAETFYDWKADEYVSEEEYARRFPKT